MTIIPGYDRVKLYSPSIPLESSLNKMRLTTYSDFILRQRMGKHRPVFKFYAATDDGYILHWGLVNAKECKDAPACTISFNVGTKTPDEIREKLLQLFGPIEQMEIHNLETKVDLYGISFKEALKSLLVPGKQIITEKWKTSIYFGSLLTSHHQIICYDKGFKENSQPNQWIRIEAKEIFQHDRPKVEAWLSGQWKPVKPFKAAILIDYSLLPFSPGEKVSLGIRGLTGLIKTLPEGKKRSIINSAKANIKLDFNEEFERWVNCWLDN